jgi:Tfp pilus assembly protein PilF
MTDNNNLERLFHAGAHGDLQEGARQLLEMDPSQGRVWKLYGSSLAVCGDWREALPALQRAREQLSDDSEVAAILGLAHFELGSYQESLEACQKALSLDAGSVSAWSTIGILLRHEGRLQEALQYQLKAHSLAQGSARVHGNLGVLYKELGQFESSIEHFRRALQLSFVQLQSAPADRLTSARPKEGRSGMPKDAAYKILDALRAYLDQEQVPWCLIAGTLLGVYRDGDLLPNDKDMDIGVSAKVDRGYLERLFCEKVGFVHLPQLGIPVEQRNVHSMSFIHSVTGITVDVILIHEEDDGRMLLGLDHVVSPIVCRIRHLDIGSFEWRGRPWPVPIPTASYLEDVYGPGWVKPDPGFDTVLSNPNRVPEAIPPTLCYGYSCLCSRMMENNWKKSLAYCRQLLARVPDPLLKDLEAWLVSLEGKA